METGAPGTVAAVRGRGRHPLEVPTCPRLCATQLRFVSSCRTRIRAGVANARTPTPAAGDVSEPACRLTGLRTRVLACGAGGALCHRPQDTNASCSVRVGVTLRRRAKALRRTRRVSIGMCAVRVARSLACRNGMSPRRGAAGARVQHLQDEARGCNARFARLASGRINNSRSKVSRRPGQSTARAHAWVKHNAFTFRRCLGRSCRCNAEPVIVRLLRSWRLNVIAVPSAAGLPTLCEHVSIIEPKPPSTGVLLHSSWMPCIGARLEC